MHASDPRHGHHSQQRPAEDPRASASNGPAATAARGTAGAGMASHVSTTTNNTVNAPVGFRGYDGPAFVRSGPRSRKLGVSSLGLAVKRKPNRTRTPLQVHFLRHLRACELVFKSGEMPVENVKQCVREMESAVWTTLLAGDFERFEAPIVNSIICRKLLESRTSYNPDVFERLLRAKIYWQVEQEKKLQKSINADIWLSLEAGESCTIKFKDEVSSTPIVWPARGAVCRHPRCFDLGTFVDINMRKDWAKWWKECKDRLAKQFKEFLIDRDRNRDRPLTKETADQTLSLYFAGVEEKTSLFRGSLYRLCEAGVPPFQPHGGPPFAELFAVEAPLRLIDALRNVLQQHPDPAATHLLILRFSDFWRGEGGANFRETYTTEPPMVELGNWYDAVHYRVKS